MKFQEVKIKELVNFLDSDLYKNSTNIPITKQRAISQFHNPRAAKDDIALIVAVDKSNQIVGFIGALPDFFYKKLTLKIAWNSCWWTDQNKGKQTALPLFLKFLKVWDNNVMFRDMTPKTKQIITRLNTFEKVKDLKGFRYFLRLNTLKILPKKNKFFLLLTPLLWIIDLVVNSFFSVKGFLVKKTINFVFKEITFLDKESIQFIENNNKNELFRRGKKELTWVLSHKWITKKSEKTNKQYYYFSDQGAISNHLLKVYDLNNKLTAVLFFTNNNGLVQLPYAYFHHNNIESIVPLIYQFLNSKKAVSFLTYNELITSNISMNKNPFWYKTKNTRAFYTSKKLIKYISDDFVFQDGEGDHVFT